MFSFTLDIYCTSVRPGRGIPHMWLSLRFLLSFYLLKGFFSSFSLLLWRVKGRGCHTLLKPYDTNCGLWIWAIQIKFDWLIDWLIDWLLNEFTRTCDSCCYTDLVPCPLGTSLEARTCVVYVCHERGSGRGERLTFRLKTWCKLHFFKLNLNVGAYRCLDDTTGAGCFFSTF